MGPGCIQQSSMHEALQKPTHPGSKKRDTHFLMAGTKCQSGGHFQNFQLSAVLIVRVFIVNIRYFLKQKLALKGQRLYRAWLN